MDHTGNLDDTNVNRFSGAPGGLDKIALGLLGEINQAVHTYREGLDTLTGDVVNLRSDYGTLVILSCVVAATALVSAGVVVAWVLCHRTKTRIRGDPVTEL